MRMKKYLIALALNLIVFTSFCQVVDLDSLKNTGSSFFTRKVTLLETRTATSLDSVIAFPSRYHFRQLQKENIVFSGYDPYYCWFRFILKNADTVRRDFILLLGPLGMRDAALYKTERGGRIFLGRTGNLYPFIKRPSQYAHYAYPISVSGQS